MNKFQNIKVIFLTFCILLSFPTISLPQGNIIDADTLIKIHIDNGEYFTYDKRIKLLTEIGDDLKNSIPDSAVYYYKIALELAQQNTDDDQEAKMLNSIGGAQYIQGEYDYALDNFVKALNIWRYKKNKIGIARGLNNVALIYNIHGKKENALENHLNSVLLCKEIGDSALLAINYFNISIVNLAMHNYDSALAYANKSVQINKLLNEEDELLKLNNLVGNIYFDRGDFLEAKSSFLKVVNMEDIDNKWELCYALAGLALVEQKAGNLEKSIFYGNKSLQLAKVIQAKWDIQHTSKILADSYALMGDFENAYKFSKENKIYSDSIYNEDKENRINYLQLKQEDFDYIMLAKENEIHVERILKKNNQMLLFALVFLFLILLAVFLYRTNRLKTKLNNQLLNKNEEIAAKNKELTQLNATKDAFFRIIGHDLKNPMSTVVSFTDMLQKNYDQFTTEEILGYIGNTKESALNALFLLENLLEWAKSQTGLTTSKPLNYNLSQLINECVSPLYNFIISKSINLTIDVHEDIEATLDKNLTSSIIRNLLSNAIKFTHKKGEISITAQKDNSGILIAVTDNGIGMSKEKLESLFLIEKASSTPGTENEKGTGVGLILCKDFIEKQEGKIWAESDPGKGSSFYIRF